MNIQDLLGGSGSGGSEHSEQQKNSFSSWQENNVNPSENKPAQFPPQQRPGYPMYQQQMAPPQQIPVQVLQQSLQHMQAFMTQQSPSLQQQQIPQHTPMPHHMQHQLAQQQQPQIPQQQMPAQYFMNFNNNNAGNSPTITQHKPNNNLNNSGSMNMFSFSNSPPQAKPVMPTNNFTNIPNNNNTNNNNNISNQFPPSYFTPLSPLNPPSSNRPPSMTNNNQITNNILYGNFPPLQPSQQLQQQSQQPLQQQQLSPQQRQQHAMGFPMSMNLSGDMIRSNSIIFISFISFLIAFSFSHSYSIIHVCNNTLLLSFYFVNLLYLLSLLLVFVYLLLDYLFINFHYFCIIFSTMKGIPNPSLEMNIPKSKTTTTTTTKKVTKKTVKIANGDEMAAYHDPSAFSMHPPGEVHHFEVLF